MGYGPQPVGWFSATVRRLGVNVVTHDVLLVGFHTWMVIWALSATGPAAELAFGRQLSLTLWALNIATILLVRAELLPAGRLRGAGYRLVLVFSLPASYAAIASLSQAIQPALFDQELWAIDRALFGGTPAEWLVRFNRFAVTEWFAFFYQSYYAILFGFLLIPPFLDRGVRLHEYLLAAALVSTLGHTCYTLVPGAGPYRVMAFAEPIHGGYWWSVAAETVRLENALDIFPSMHTAMPTMFALYLFRNRRRKPFTLLWPVVGFFTANIIVATMLLRWHWGIDVVVGLALAIGAHVGAVRIVRWERSRRDGRAQQPVWEPVFPWQCDSQRSAHSPHQPT